jgi:hypothetical protein
MVVALGIFGVNIDFSNTAGINVGDVSYERLSGILLPDLLCHGGTYLHPFYLLVITRFGIPESTTFLIFNVFSSGLRFNSN